jgi:hypothetical protein
MRGEQASRVIDECVSGRGDPQFLTHQVQPVVAGPSMIASAVGSVRTMFWPVSLWRVPR